MDSKTYDVLKKIALIMVPLAAFVASVSEIIGFHYGAIIAAIITAFGTFLGNALDISSKHYWNDVADENDAEGEEEVG